MTTARYELFYWPFTPGRGERVRLAFEASGTAYDDVCRKPDDQGGGTAALMALLSAQTPRPSFAPPLLRHGELVLAQTSNILHYLGPRLGLVPEDEATRSFALQLELTLADLVDEAHDVHHPLGSGLYYEDQKPEALRRSGEFTGKRLPKFLGYFEKVLKHSGGRGLLGGELSYPDLSAFQILAGLDTAFPNAMRRLRPSIPGLSALQQRIRALPRISAYLASERFLPENEQGIFRPYPELDPET